MKELHKRKEKSRGDLHVCVDLHVDLARVSREFLPVHVDLLVF